MLESGFSSVAAVTLESGQQTLDSVLKVALPRDDRTVAVEARLLATLATYTDVPVPEVLGVLDDHESLPTPAMLTRAVDGEQISYSEIGFLSDDRLQSIATQVGQNMAQLHALDSVDRFGTLDYDRSRQLAGAAPSDSLNEIVVGDGCDTWDAFVSDWVDAELDRFDGCRFDDFASDIRMAVEAADTTTDFGPVLVRNDHSPDNLLVEREAGTIQASIDWGFSLAATPEFDLAYATYIYGGAFVTGHSEVSDRRKLVRSALLDGYRTVDPNTADSLSEPRSAFQLLAAVRGMIDFDVLVPSDHAGAVERGLRDQTESVIEDCLR